MSDLHPPTFEPPPAAGSPSPLPHPALAPAPAWRDTMRSVLGTAVVVAVALLALGFGYRHLTHVEATPASTTSTPATVTRQPMGPPDGGFRDGRGPRGGGPRR